MLSLQSTEKKKRKKKKKAKEEEDDEWMNEWKSILLFFQVLCNFSFVSDVKGQFF